MTLLTPGRRVQSVDEITQPGDYWLNPLGAGTDARPSLWFWLPVDDPDRFEGQPQLNRIAAPPWRFRECADGSIEVRDSIRTYAQSGAVLWHGFLDEGNVWRQI